MNDFVKHCQQYYENYNDYFTTKKNYQYNANKQKVKIIYSTNFNLRIYFSKINNNLKTFLVIPSIFNSYKILFINPKKTFIDYLLEYGQVIIIEWLKRPNKNDNLDSYIHDIIFVQKYLLNQKYYNLNLIGHCLGGNIALAATICQPNSVNSLTLLTTPWNFSNYHKLTNQFRLMNLDLSYLDYIPKVYLQSIFFLLSPISFFNKIFNYYQADDIKKEFFFEIEEWLLSGPEITKNSFFQLINEIIDKNIIYEQTWQVDDKIIDLSQINIPVCQVNAKNDWLVPKETNIIFSKTLSNLRIIETKGGHVSYLTSYRIEKFFALYSLWLNEVL